MSDKTEIQTIRLKRAFGNRVALTRLGRGLTQHQLAKMAHTNQASIARGEKQGIGSVAYFVRLMRALGCDVDIELKVKDLL